MKIFTRITRRADSSPAPVHVPRKDLDQLVTAIADSQARLLVIADRVSAGRAEPGDEARLRIQREITASYCKRLDRIALPTSTADDAENWLRSLTTPA